MTTKISAELGEVELVAVRQYGGKRQCVDILVRVPLDEEYDAQAAFLAACQRNNRVMIVTFNTGNQSFARTGS